MSRRIRAFLRRDWQRLLRLREKVWFSEEAVHLFLAGGVGILGALVNLVFRQANEFVQWLFLGEWGNLVEIAVGLPGWARLLVPTAGAAVAGLVLRFGLRLAALPGSTNLLEVVVVGDGRLNLRPALLKSASSLLSISTGGSIGREGPITHLSATLASKLGQWLGWHPYRLRLLVACGAAAGIAAAYNAPVAGAVFAAQIVLGNFAMNLFAPLVFASVVAIMVSHSFLAVPALYDVPGMGEMASMSDLPWFVLLGILSGVLGAAFLRMLRWSERLFERIPLPLAARMALAGLALGVLAWAGLPQVWGNGYGVNNQILRQAFALDFLALLFVAKLAATLLTVGSGAVGGVFTPTLFLGASFGSCVGLTLHGWNLALDLPLAAFALAGMGSILAATTHSPLLAMILVFEISLDHVLIPPLMIACAVSTLVGRALHRENVYTEPLRRRGIELMRENPRLGAATQQTVGDVMRSPVPPLNQKTGFREIADRFLTNANNFLPVVNDKGRLTGIVALQDLKQHLTAGAELDSVIAYDIMRPPPPCLTPDQKLVDAFPVLLASELQNVPVINTRREARLVGAVVRAEALGLLSEAIASREPGKR